MLSMHSQNNMWVVERRRKTKTQKLVLLGGEDRGTEMNFMCKIRPTTTGKNKP